MTYGTGSLIKSRISLYRTTGLKVSENAVAHAAWITVSTVWCDKVEAKADLMEYRIYPNEILPDFPGYQVSARNCSQSIACNLESIACKWAFTNPDTDPFVT